MKIFKDIFLLWVSCFNITEDIRLNTLHGLAVGFSIGAIASGATHLITIIYSELPHILIYSLVSLLLFLLVISNALHRYYK